LTWIWITLFFGVCAGLLSIYVYFIEIRKTDVPGDDMATDAEPSQVGS
jgi:hypothetical protein